MTGEKPRIVVAGGGTGTYTVLIGLKKHPVDLSAITSSADSGGSSGALRDDYGMLPPGDNVQCLIALSECDPILRDVFSHRINGDGGVSGHRLGNLFLLALNQISNDPLKAMHAAHEILRVRGRVIPVSAHPAELCAELEDSSILVGEHAIDTTSGPRPPIARCFLSRPVEPNQEALEAIERADALVIGPGDLYTSLVPVLLVNEIAETIARSRAKRIFVMNLATKRGETDGYAASRFVRVIEDHLSAKLDHVIVNAVPASETLLERYRKAGEPPVENDLADTNVLRAELLSDKIVEPIKGDQVRRSLLRHDSAKLASAIMHCVIES